MQKNYGKVISQKPKEKQTMSCNKSVILKSVHSFKETALSYALGCRDECELGPLLVGQGCLPQGSKGLGRAAEQKRLQT